MNGDVALNNNVIPAEAGIHLDFRARRSNWIPAFAGMTRIGDDEDWGMTRIGGMTRIEG